MKRTMVTIVILLVVCKAVSGWCSDEEKFFRTVHLPVKIRIAAHRGANEFAPENTLAAFRKAVELGVDLVEIDVRKTKDDINIIMHDSTLKRTTGLDGNVADWNYDDLKDVSAGKWFSDEFALEKIPTLEDVCREVKKWNEILGKNVSFYVDCKYPELATMIQTLQDYGFLETSVFYGSDTVLEKIHELIPQARVMPAYGRGQQLQNRIDGLKPYAFDTSWVLLTSELVDYLHSQGVKVYSDAPQNATKEELLNAIKTGVDLIQTDRIFNAYEAEGDCQ
jgi:glycerophosphoryl diester phosphodiesterase